MDYSILKKDVIKCFNFDNLEIPIITQYLDIIIDDNLGVLDMFTKNI